MRLDEDVAEQWDVDVQLVRPSSPHALDHLSSRPMTARTSPAVELASAASAEPSSCSLGLPVEDLSSREKDMRSFQTGTHGDGAVVPLRVAEVHDGLHRILSDLKCSLVSSICCGL